jgi:hypothetical protein
MRRVVLALDCCRSLPNRCEGIAIAEAGRKQKEENRGEFWGWVEDRCPATSYTCQPTAAILCNDTLRCFGNPFPQWGRRIPMRGIAPCEMREF